MIDTQCDIAWHGVYKDKHAANLYVSVILNLYVSVIFSPHNNLPTK
jgi:hypothetical protein